MSEKTMPSYTIRTMQLSDSEEVRELWSALEWDIYKYSNEMMLINDPNGVFVAQENATGKLLGVCGCVNLSPELSFVCMYAVREDCQGLGIGTALWAKGIEHMGDRNASLFAANVKMQEIYKNHHNFKAIPQRKRLLMKGKPVVNALTASISGICLVDMNDKNIADVIEYDKQVCDGVDRSAALRALNGTFDNINSVAINDNNQVMGYCVVSETVSVIVRGWGPMGAGMLDQSQTGTL
ncbi:unnamed protein product [Medioppia subpectinata]|uniref:N-acetyltransferase domain-containing protein n=1 Tax=Medioppia subpectinata TaxID=1979941 RepID=A0A7R9KB15_9ACAR|nr:unnamed protein product [Medioppia subpectinata]CAG2100148.1 unnamed protein product [Medioppia subpectinata]